MVPNPYFPDGIEHKVEVVETDIELVYGNSESDCPGSAEMTLPVVGIKPDCGCPEIEDVTPEEIEKMADRVFGDGENTDSPEDGGDTPSDNDDNKGCNCTSPDMLATEKDINDIAKSIFV